MAKPCLCQVPKENLHDLTKNELGFIYYTDKEYPTFVPIKDQLHAIRMADFSTEKLNIGLQVNWQQLALDTLEKYQHISKVLNYSKDHGEVNLRIIPVRLYYVIYKYAKSEIQMKQASNTDKFRLSDKFVLIKSFGGLPIRVDSIRAL
jgi:hypothetical protein